MALYHPNILDHLHSVRFDCGIQVQMVAREREDISNVGRKYVLPRRRVGPLLLQRQDLFPKTHPRQH